MTPLTVGVLENLTKLLTPPAEMQGVYFLSSARRSTWWRRNLSLMFVAIDGVDNQNTGNNRHCGK